MSSRAAGLPRTGSRNPLALRRRAFERYFNTLLPPPRRLPARLHAAMRWGALSPGKRLRPLLVLTACEATGTPWTRALPAAAAVECVHAFSLVHDDLPAMDDDDFRRGRATVHREFGEALGVLAGDALLALAFEAVAGLEARGVPARRVTRAVRLLARAAGSLELIGGQVLDLEGEGRSVTARDVAAIHRRKTGALMATSLVLGGLAGNASSGDLIEFERMGRDLGLAFQIHDDLLNLGSSLERLGKRAGTDSARGKATYPRAVGEARARLEAAQRIEAALEGARRFGPCATALVTLIEATARRDR